MIVKGDRAVWFCPQVIKRRWLIMARCDLRCGIQITNDLDCLVMF